MDSIVSHFLQISNRLLYSDVFKFKLINISAENWRKLHNEELHNFYSSPNIIRMIKSRRMSWAGHVARMGETRNAYRILVGKPVRNETTRKTKT
jgi:hypothetical protein